MGDSSSERAEEPYHIPGVSDDEVPVAAPAPSAPKAKRKKAEGHTTAKRRKSSAKAADAARDEHSASIVTGPVVLPRNPDLPEGADQELWDAASTWPFIQPGILNGLDEEAKRIVALHKALQRQLAMYERAVETMERGQDARATGATLNHLLSKVVAPKLETIIISLEQLQHNHAVLQQRHWENWRNTIALASSGGVGSTGWLPDPARPSASFIRQPFLSV